MGAIQQAFNQALAIGAIATAPMVKQNMKKQAEQEAITKAETEAEQAYDRMEEVFGAKKGTYSEQQMKDVLNEVYEAQKASYKARPSLEKGALKAELYENLKEWNEPAEKAAKNVAATRDQYKDQIAMLHSIAEGVRFGSTQPNKKGGAK